MANAIAVLLGQLEVEYVFGGVQAIELAWEVRAARITCSWMSCNSDTHEAYDLLVSLISWEQPQERTLRVISALQLECNGHALRSGL